MDFKKIDKSGFPLKTIGTYSDYNDDDDNCNNIKQVIIALVYFESKYI